MTSEAYSAYLCTRDVRTEDEVGFGTRDCADTGSGGYAGPTPTPAAHARRPSLGPRPSGPAGPLAWTQASLEEDWPAPVRPEPAGGAIVVPLEDELRTRSSRIPGRHRVRCPSVGRHPGAAGRRGARSSSTSSRTSRRSWLPPSNGSRTASSSMTIATASRTGGSGSTTSQAERRWVGGTPGVDHRPPHRSNGRRQPGGPWRELRSRVGTQAPPRIPLPARRSSSAESLRVEAGPRAGRPLLRVGLGDREWSGRGHGLCPRCRVAGSPLTDDPAAFLRRSCRRRRLKQSCGSRRNRQAHLLCNRTAGPVIAGPARIPIQ